MVFFLNTTQKLSANPRTGRAPVHQGKRNCSTDFYLTVSTWRQVCSKMVPRLLTPERKEIRMNICADILQNIENDPNFLENVITCDESWFFFFNTTQKVSANPRTGRAPVHQDKRKHGRANPNLKKWWSFFPDIRGTVHVDWVPEGQTVNQIYYKQGRIKLFGAPRQWKHFRPLFQTVFLSGVGGYYPPSQTE